MGFLSRSKSTAAKDLNSHGKKDRTTAERTASSVADEPQKRSVSRERPQTADRRKSSSRPRTANKATDLPVFDQTIEIRSGDHIFNFPTPTSSPRLPPPRSATFEASPSPFSVLESPAIGVALGSPSQAPMPTWGRSFTADHVSKRMPAQLQPARVPPAIPEQPGSGLERPELRKKKSNWKSFGSLFGRKSIQPAADEPFYKLQVAQGQERAAGGMVTPSPGASPIFRTEPAVSTIGSQTKAINDARYGEVRSPS